MQPNTEQDIFEAAFVPLNHHTVYIIKSLTIFDIQYRIIIYQKKSEIKNVSQSNLRFKYKKGLYLKLFIKNTY